MISLGFIEAIFIFLIGIVVGVILAYQLFSIELSEQLLHYENKRMMDELRIIVELMDNEE